MEVRTCLPSFLVPVWSPSVTKAQKYPKLKYRAVRRVLHMQVNGQAQTADRILKSSNRRPMLGPGTGVDDGERPSQNGSIDLEAWQAIPSRPYLLLSPEYL